MGDENLIQRSYDTLAKLRQTASWHRCPLRLRSHGIHDRSLLRVEPAPLFFRGIRVLAPNFVALCDFLVAVHIQKLGANMLDIIPRHHTHACRVVGDGNTPDPATATQRRALSWQSFGAALNREIASLLEECEHRVPGSVRAIAANGKIGKAIESGERYDYTACRGSGSFGRDRSIQRRKRR